MDLLNLAAKITLDDSSYTKGINNAEKLGQQMQSKLSAMTIAAGNIATDMLRKGAQAVQNIIGGAVDGYADYQQLVGGVETLFKSSSKKVQEYASQSYKTTGLSANKYMETVTSFSASLLQGLGGNTELAAELANTAITDMADNANKMGTDISSIQTAYQGFAKQNYTMLDNLKLGYGGTKEEMVRLINDSGILDKKIKNLDGITFDQLVMAIHEIQTEMGITGTTAEEAAETISGSKASLKAAWQDMLTAAGGMSDADFDAALANFKTSFSTYMENFVPSLVLSINSSGSLVKAVAEAVADLPTDLLSEVANAGVEAGTGAVSGLSKITSWLVESIANMFKSASADTTQIADLGVAIGDFIGTAISDIVTNAPAILEGIVNVGVALAGGLVEGLFKGLFGEGELQEAFDEIDKETSDSMKNATENATKSNAVLNYLDDLIAKYGEAASETDEWKNAQDRLKEYLPDAGQVFEDYGQDIGGAVSQLRELNEETYKFALEEAKRKALKKKQDAMTDAQANLLEAQSEIQIAEYERGSAEDQLISYFAGKGKQIDSFEGMNGSQVKSAVETMFNEVTGGPGNKEYEDMKPVIDTWVKTISDSDTSITDLKATVGDLESQLKVAQTSYLTSSAAIDDLTGSASGAAQALMAIRNPETTYNSGQYAAWYYSGGSYTPHATGMDYVPYDGYRAELHRGEAIVPAGENRRGSAAAGSPGMEEQIIAAIKAGMAGATVPVFLDGREITDAVNRNNMRELKAARYSG